MKVLEQIDMLELVHYCAVFLPLLQEEHLQQDSFDEQASMNSGLNAVLVSVHKVHKVKEYKLCTILSFFVVKTGFIILLISFQSLSRSLAKFCSNLRAS